MPAKTSSLVYRACWERAQSVAMCQAAVVSVALGADEFAGVAAGYIGEGKFRMEPFHVRFRGDEASHLVIGERSMIDGKTVWFEHWSTEARRAYARAVYLLQALLQQDAEAFLVATPMEARRIKWSARTEDEGASGEGELDSRVWDRIPAQLGVAGWVE